MIKKIVTAGALALVVVGLSAPSASASCNPPKFISTYNAGSGAFAYWHSTLAETAGSALVNKMWSGTTDFTGSCNFLYFAIAPGDIGLTGSFGDACLPGTACPSGGVSVLAAVTKGGNTDLLVTQSAPESLGFFDFSATAHNMIATARPRVTNSSRATNVVTLAIAVDAVASGAFDGTSSQITGYKIRQATSATDPGRLASAYPTVLATAVGGAGGTAATAGGNVTCDDTAPRWIATQIVTAAGDSPVVGPATQINCNPAVANPRYRIVPKSTTIDKAQ